MRFVVGMFALMCFAYVHSTLAAEVYRYVDDEGTVNYVDSIAKVPERYRLQLLSPEERAKLENIDTTQVLLFPYELVENDALKLGLWEDAHGRPISRAHAVRFILGKARIEKIARYKIHFEHKDGSQEALVVYKVNVKSKDFRDLQGKPIHFEQLSGFMLKSSLPKDEM